MKSLEPFDRCDHLLYVPASDAFVFDSCRSTVDDSDVVGVVVTHPVVVPDSHVPLDHHSLDVASP